ncbi:unnamed protein product [Prorocentrum cordatum]|nr:unnamed protein product [Polarella glacialis]
MRRWACVGAAWAAALLPDAVGELSLATLRHSNLAGLGPDVGAPHEIRYGDAARSAVGKHLDLVIVAREGDYTPFNASENTNGGRGSQVGSISHRCGRRSRSSLVFRLVGANESASAAPEVADDFLVTFFIVDKRMQLQLHGFDDFFLSDGSQLKFRRISRGGVWVNPGGFTTELLPADAFHDPGNLTRVEQDFAVTLLFRNTSEFRVEVAVTGPHKGKGVDLVFAGAPLQLFCPAGSGHRPEARNSTAELATRVQRGCCSFWSRADSWPLGARRSCCHARPGTCERLGAVGPPPAGRSTSTATSPWSSSAASLASTTTASPVAASPTSSSETAATTSTATKQITTSAVSSSTSPAVELRSSELDIPLQACMDRLRELEARWTAAKKMWSGDKAHWCCKHHGVGCSSTTVAVSTLASTAASTSTATGTMVDHHHLGSASSGSPGCRVECERAGITATCGDWARWAGQHHRSGRENVSACAAAHPLVVKHCPECASCTAADACRGAAETTTTAATTATVTSAEADASEGTGACAGWRAGRQQRCCEQRSIGCLSRKEVLDSCAHGLQREASFMTPARRQFCCRHLPSPGCPREAMDMVLPVSLEECRPTNDTSSADRSEVLEDWCCLHESLRCGAADADESIGLPSRPGSTTTTTRTGTTTTRTGTTSTATSKRAVAVRTSWPSASRARTGPGKAAALFDCDIGLEDWANRWSLSKLRWCCSLGDALVHARLSRDSACIETLQEYGGAGWPARGEHRPAQSLPWPSRVAGALCVGLAVLFAPLALRPPLAARLRAPRAALDAAGGGGRWPWRSAEAHAYLAVPHAEWLEGPTG